MKFLVLSASPETRDKYSTCRPYTSRPKNSTTTTAKFKYNITSSTFSLVGSHKGVPTSRSFTRGTSSMLSYLTSSKDIHSISCICKTQRDSYYYMGALSATFSSSSNMLLLSALSSTCLQDRRYMNIILIVRKCIQQIQHIQFFKPSITARLNAS